MMFRMLAGSVLAFILVSSLALAQLFEPDAAMVQRLATLARAQLAQARLPDGSPVPVETPTELAVPIVPFELDTQTVRRGVLTAEMQVCGSDWENGSFRPYMDQLRASGRYSAKQLAYLGLLHGVAQGVVYETMKPHIRSCSTGSIRRLDRAAAIPIQTP